MVRVSSIESSYRARTKKPSEGRYHDRNLGGFSRELGDVNGDSLDFPQLGSKTKERTEITDPYSL